MTALCAEGDYARCGEHFFDYFWLIPGSDTGNQEGISPVATGDSGLCPENPQPLKRLAKLSVIGAEVISFL